MGGGNGTQPPETGVIEAPFEVPETDEEDVSLEGYVMSDEAQKANLNRQWLVDGILEEDRIYQVYGDWKAGKSLAVMDMCGHLSLPMNWAGKSTAQALVVWVAGEAVDDVKARLQAFMRHNNVSGEDMAFCLREKPVYLTDIEQAILLRREIKTLKKRYPGLPVVVVIDTLNRNFGPGRSENSSEDMGAFVSNLIDVVARPTKATVLVIHHAGHMNKERGRGHSSFPAAVDGTLKVEKSGTGPEFVTLTVQEARSTPSDGRVAFRIDVHELPWHDNFGRAIEAPVLHCVEAAEAAPKNPTPTQKKAMEVLRTQVYEAETRLREQGREAVEPRIDFESWRKRCESEGVFTHRTQWKRIKDGLLGEWVIHEGIHVRLVDGA